MQRGIAVVVLVVDVKVLPTLQVNLCNIHKKPILTMLYAKLTACEWQHFDIDRLGFLRCDLRCFCSNLCSQRAGKQRTFARNAIQFTWLRLVQYGAI